MRDIEFNLPKAQAEKMLPMLERIRESARGEEKKVITDLIKTLTPQMEEGKKKVKREEEQALISTTVSDLASMVVRTLPLVKQRGLSSEVVSYVSTIEKALLKAEKDVEAAREAFANTLPKGQRGTAELSSEQFSAAVAPSRRKIERAITDFSNSGNDPIGVSSTYNLEAKREVMANKCFASALGIGRNAAGWKTELDMVSLCFSDMNTHLKLGVALLGGNPKQIWQAYSMDTGCRDELDEKVWEFINEEMDDNLKRTARPSPKR